MLDTPKPKATAPQPPPQPPKKRGRVIWRFRPDEAPRPKISHLPENDETI